MIYQDGFRKRNGNCAFEKLSEKWNIHSQPYEWNSYPNTWQLVSKEFIFRNFAIVDTTSKPQSSYIRKNMPVLMIPNSPLNPTAVYILHSCCTFALLKLMVGFPFNVNVFHVKLMVLQGIVDQMISKLLMYINHIHLCIKYSISIWWTNPIPTAELNSKGEIEYEIIFQNFLTPHFWDFTLLIKLTEIDVS